MYYVFKLNGEVVNIQKCDMPDVNVCRPLVDGKCDSISRAPNLEALQALLAKEIQPETLSNDSHVDRLVRVATGKAEAFINDLCDKLLEAKKGDLKSILDRARAAGKTMLDDALEQAKKKKTK